MAARSQDESPSGPVTLQELADRGFVVYRNGSRGVRLIVIDEDNEKHSFALPTASAEEQKAESNAWETKILEYLAKSPAPVPKSHLDKVLNRGSRSGRYGMTIARLTRERKIFTADSCYVDDPKKFDSPE